MGTPRTIFQGLKLTFNIDDSKEYVKGKYRKRLEKGADK
jgi:hypothetical protein